MFLTDENKKVMNETFDVIMKYCENTKISVEEINKLRNKFVG